MNQYSKVKIKCTREQTMPHLLIPLFLGHPVHRSMQIPTLPEIEYREYEKELNVIKEKEGKKEAKIRAMRKDWNRPRLVTEKGQPSKKRRKAEDNNHISIRKTWEQPRPTAP